MKKAALKIPSKAVQIFRNFGFLTIGKIIGDVFTFIFFVVLSRIFGQDGVGQYSFAIAFTGFFFVFADFGLYHLSIKEMSRERHSFGEYCGRIFLVRLSLSVIVLAVMLCLLLFSSLPRETKLVIAIIGAYQIIYTIMDGFSAVFIATEDMHLAGLLEFSLKAVIALLAIMVAIAGGNLVMVLIAFPVVTLGQVIIAYRLVIRRYGKIRLSASWSNMAHSLREASPYGITMFLRQLTTRVDIVFLGFFLSTTAAGVYNAAYRIVFLLIFIPHFAGIALFPSASRLYITSREKLEELYHESLKLAVLVGLPAAAGLCLIAPDLIHLIFGAAFTESILILRFLSCLLFLACLKNIMGVFLISCDRQKERTKCQGWAACISVLGNGLLIPTLGIIGAAIATLISEILIVFLFSLQIKSVLGWPRVGSRLIISAMATAIFCLPLAFFPSPPLYMVIPASVLLYLGTLLLFKSIRTNEVRTLIDVLKREFGSSASPASKVF